MTERAWSLSCIASGVLNIVYGFQISDLEDPYIALLQKAVGEFAEAKVPGRYLVEYFPFLKHIPGWVPGSAARRTGDRIKPLALQVKNQPYDAVKNGQVIRICIPNR